MALKMINMKDIYWLAGLLEGEGCFFLNQKKYPEICVHMADKDVLDEVARIMDAKVYGPYKNVKKWRIRYSVHIRGKKAIGWMMTLYILMKQRRQQKIKEILLLWKSFPGKLTGRSLVWDGNRNKKAVEGISGLLSSY